MKPKTSPPPKELVMLGLAISGATMLPGQRRTCQEIANFIAATIEVMTGEDRGFSRERVRQIADRGLRKMRFRMRRELAEHFEVRNPHCDRPFQTNGDR